MEIWRNINPQGVSLNFHSCSGLEFLFQEWMFILQESFILYSASGQLVMLQPKICRCDITAESCHRCDVRLMETTKKKSESRVGDGKKFDQLVSLWPTRSYWYEVMMMKSPYFKFNRAELSAIGKALRQLHKYATRLVLLASGHENGVRGQKGRINLFFPLGLFLCHTVPCPFPAALWLSPSRTPPSSEPG